MTDSVPIDYALLNSWLISLAAERKSPRTLEVYDCGVRKYLYWCENNDRALVYERAAVVAFAAWMNERYEATTASVWLLANRRFSAWLYDEEEADFDPLAGIETPKPDEKITVPHSADELRAMVAACKGPGFLDRRDEALLRFVVECGTRATETTRMLLSETKVAGGTAVLRGKGGKERITPFGPQTGRALDRYIRARRGHVLAETDVLWLGTSGRALGYQGLYKALGKRAAAAGVDGFHPHRLRHTFADRWLDAGGSEGGLMAVGGWSRRESMDRYVRSRRAARAVDESRGLGLGDL